MIIGEAGLQINDEPRRAAFYNFLKYKMAATTKPVSVSS